MYSYNILIFNGIVKSNNIFQSFLFYILLSLDTKTGNINASNGCKEGLKENYQFYGSLLSNGKYSQIQFQVELQKEQIIIQPVLVGDTLGSIIDLQLMRYISISMIMKNMLVTAKCCKY